MTAIFFFSLAGSAMNFARYIIRRDEAAKTDSFPTKFEAVCKSLSEVEISLSLLWLTLAIFAYLVGR